MYKIKTNLVIYCLAYFLPVRIPETGVYSAYGMYCKVVRDVSFPERSTEFSIYYILYSYVSRTSFKKKSVYS